VVRIHPAIIAQAAATVAAMMPGRSFSASAPANGLPKLRAFRAVPSADAA
jgi:alkanesulfonate monooxygenase SsuD/methylene tetrahydromethanopterin reductase-like flavin-dependent oxidoreductase (luciferase family)